MRDAIDLASKIIGALAALLGLTGYVLVLGAAILWFRLDDANLPHEAPIALAGREELIATGAQAVAVWLILVIMFGGLAAWIVVGDPERRRFGPLEAGLAIAVTVSAILALESTAPGLVALPAAVAVLTTLLCLLRGVAVEAVVAAMLPTAAGLGLAVAFSIPGMNGFAEAAGAAFIFIALMAAAPVLQRWRTRRGANRAAIAQIESRARAGEDRDPADLELIEALGHPGTRSASPDSVAWVRRIAIGVFGLLAFGAIAVASQVQRDQDFHRAVVSLANGDCVSGVYITRGSDQIVLAQPEREEEEEDGDKTGVADQTSETEPGRRIATFPTREVLEVQIYGAHSSDDLLERHVGCADHPTMISATDPGGGEAEEAEKALQEPPEDSPPAETEVNGSSLDDGHIPVIDWKKPGTIATTACPKATLRLTIVGGGLRSFHDHMQEIPGSIDHGGATARYGGTYPPLYPGHGSARVVITGTCRDDSPVDMEFGIDVDP